MLPKWFNRWNRDNPTDIEMPAILVGGLGGAVVVVTLLVILGQPFATDSLQTGPRGNGMVITKFETALDRPDPTIPGAAVEGDDAVAAMRQWTGIPDLFENAESYQTQVAYRMIEMTQNINENWGDHVNANKEVGVTCYTCHRGEPVPSNIWFQMTPTVEAMAGWSANQNRVTTLSSFTSLPSDALQKYLVDGEIIGVHDLESRVAGIPGRDDYPGIQNAERTYGLMNYFANSLGVGCVFCHNTRAFYDPAQVTPQWSTASLGIIMVQELNNDYVMPLAELLPPERLGPVHGDAPKVACATCHKGQQQPLQGTNVIGSWPQLATVGTEVAPPPAE